MDITDFELAVEATQNRDPVLFALPGEGPMSQQEIESAEVALGVALPDKFKWFLGQFGAGHFALAIIYSVVSSETQSVVAARELPWIDPTCFFPIADNGAGDYWGFVLDHGGRASAEVHVLDHEVGSVRKVPSYDDFLDFAAAIGLA